VEIPTVNVCRIAALLLSVPAMATAQNVAIGAYPVGPPNISGPNAITLGPDGAVWYTLGSGSIGRMIGTAAFTEYPIPTPNSAPEGIAVGPDGALWFTESAANKIGRITTAGVVTEFPVTTAASEPYGIALGPDGALWFTEYAADQIGRITTAGAITEYRNTYGAYPSGITAGPNGALWFTESTQVGSIGTNGAISAWEVICTSNSPQAIVTGSDGALWFTEGCANTIGRITTAGATTEYHAFGTAPLAIAVGADGALWFTDSLSNTIGRITTAGFVTDFQAPPINFENTGTTGIVLGPDSALWFTEFGAGMVGEAVFLSANLIAERTVGHPGPGADGTSLGFSGSMFAPNEDVEIFQNGIGSAELTWAQADSSGSFSNTVTSRELPNTPFGYRIFLAAGRTSGKIGAAGFSVTSELIANPVFGKRGSTFTLSGYGYAAFDTVQIYWGNPRSFLGTVAADITGTFSSGNFTVPADAAVGVNHVQGTGTMVPAASDEAPFSVQ
jgi:virginiamycin B lyase